MSWRIRVRGGLLKVKPRWQRRFAEREHKVPVVDLGIIIISWWDADAIRLYDS